MLRAETLYRRAETLSEEPLGKLGSPRNLPLALFLVKVKIFTALVMEEFGAQALPRKNVTGVNNITAEYL